MFRSGGFLTLIGYSSRFPEISEEDELNQIYDLPHNDWLNPDKVLSLGGPYMIFWECRQMVLLLVPVC